MYPAKIRTKNPKLLQGHVSISVSTTTTIVIYISRQDGDDLKGALQYMVFHLLYQLGGPFSRSQAAGEFRFNTHNYGTDNS